MESRNKEISRHKDTIVSSNSYETCIYTYNTSASSSKVQDTTRLNNPGTRKSKLSIKFASLVEKDSILDSYDIPEKREQVRIHI